MIRELFRQLLEGRRAPSRIEILPDRVWISATAKINGVRAELNQSSARGTSLIALVAHFSDVLRELEEVVASYSGPSSVRAVLAGQLSAESAAQLPLGESDALDLIVAERHPLASVDEDLIRVIEALPCRCRLVYHLSVDDPLLVYFGVDSIRSLLGQLAITDKQPIAHPFVAQSIRRAQAKIEADAISHSTADSAAEWLQMNMRR